MSMVMCRLSLAAVLLVLAVCTENLNPNVLTMKSAQYGARIYDAGSLNLARDRRIFVQSRRSRLACFGQRQAKCLAA
jgi:hypothetical protein